MNEFVLIILSNEEIYVHCN